MKQILSTLIFLIPFTLQSQDCNCESNFKWVKKTFEENDAGFSYILEKKGQSAYEHHNELFTQKVKNITDPSECGVTLYKWLTFFRSEHIGIKHLYPRAGAHSNPQTSSESKKEKTAEEIREQFRDWEKLEVDLPAFEKYLLTKKEPGLEGVWKSGIYTIGIKKEGKDYIGFIIEADGVYWTKGQVKLRINQEEDRMKVVYYMRDHSAREFEFVELLGNNYLFIGLNTLLKRIKPQLPNDIDVERYLKAINTSKPYFEQLNERTTYLRIPSFSGEYKEVIDSVILNNKGIILNTENLIIDIRNNGGGRDGAYRELIPILYTNPIRILQTEFLSTPLNNQIMMNLANNPKFQLEEELTEWARTAYNKLRRHIGEFVNIDSIDVDKITLDTIYSYPTNIGIIINGSNVSATEQFLLAAKQSKKVKLFGTTTAGGLDISLKNEVTSPCEEYSLVYYTSRSLRIPRMAIDDKGIQPDYYIDESIPRYRWIRFVNEVLNE